MYFYEVIGRFIKLAEGMLCLDKDQYRKRQHQVKVIENEEDESRTYAIKQTVTFKKGEVFGYDGALAKNCVNEVKMVCEDGSDMPEDTEVVPEVLENSEGEMKVPPADPVEPEADAGEVVPEVLEPLAPMEPVAPEGEEVPPAEKMSLKDLAEKLEVSLEKAMEMVAEHGVEAKAGNKMIDAEVVAKLLAE